MIIEEYKIIQSGSPAGLEKLVNEQIKNGWEPFGSVAASNRGMICTFMQAMVKKTL